MAAQNDYTKFLADLLDGIGTRQEPGVLKDSDAVTADQAVAIINTAAWRPGWRVTAQRAVIGGSDIWVQVRMDTYDSSDITPGGSYSRPIVIGPMLPLDVTGLTRDQLLYAVLQLVLFVDEHEHREFLRVRDENGQWVAPFHPHRPDGRDKWADEAARDVGRLAARMRRETL